MMSRQHSVSDFFFIFNAITIINYASGKSCETQGKFSALIILSIYEMPIHVLQFSLSSSCAHSFFPNVIAFRIPP